jgi:poly-gamma-glutamate capsule biosynthesis protein CapA/YwtB (metallophosphatase superfamily)
VIVRLLTVAALAVGLAPAAHAQTPTAPAPPAPAPTPTPTLPPAPEPPPPALHLQAPKLVASAIRVPVKVTGATPNAWVALEVGGDRVGRTKADAQGVAQTAVPAGTRVERLRVRAVGYQRSPSPTKTVRMRDITLAAFGDANFGDGVGDVMSALGPRYPWSGVAPTLKQADIAFGNLECAVSTQGAPVPKEFNFRGSPAALRSVVPYAGLDVLNLANNHVGDYGTAALLDTVRSVKDAGAQPVGAGTLEEATRPAVVSRLGLRVAFVGFSDVVPAGFAVGPGHPGTATADPATIRATVAKARRAADVVVATFHWGIERDTHESARQRELAQIAASAGASAVIGAHPHVLQPIDGLGPRRVVAYSLGNFVWAAGSAASAATGILEVQLSQRGVESYRLRRATIVNTRPQLD